MDKGQLIMKKYQLSIVNCQLKNLPKYESYKDSGFEWLGEIPQDWDVKKVKFLFQIGRGRVISQQELDDDGVYPVYSSQTKNDGILGYISSYDFDCDQLTWTTDGANAGTVFLRKGKHNCTNVCGTLKPISSDKLDLIYISHSLSVSAQFYKRPDTNGAKIMNGEMANVFIAFPPISEQREIARFLDEKTAQIDEAIGIKEQQIALLKERKQIIIQNAVTKGLNLNAPMKDSGVDWIGKIPSHWKVEKLFGLCRFVRGNSAFAKDELLSNGQYVALQYGKTYKVDEVDNSYEFYVNEEFYKESQVVNFGDIIFISTSETIEDLGHSAIYNRDDVGLLGGEQLIIKPNSDLLDHYYIYYSTKVFSKTLRKYATGIKVFRFNINDLKTIYTGIPPKDEQAKIASYITESSLEQSGQCNTIYKKAQIDKLKEYKASLINSAVTGKNKVN